MDSTHTINIRIRLAAKRGGEPFNLSFDFDPHFRPYPSSPRMSKVSSIRFNNDDDGHVFQPIIIICVEVKLTTTMKERWKRRNHRARKGCPPLLDCCHWWCVTSPNLTIQTFSAHANVGFQFDPIQKGSHSSSGIECWFANAHLRSLKEYQEFEHQAWMSWYDKLWIIAL